jgi:hypothetical protein
MNCRVQQPRWELAVKDVVAISCKLMYGVFVFWRELKLPHNFSTQWVG